MTDVVVVESPAKAKTINKYLGGGYTVLASFGHVRDLPPKDGSVRPDEDFAMDWAADERGNRQVAAIAKAVKGADTLYLATDPDREGEAISWHVRAMLEEKRALKGVDVKRITFNEITSTADPLRHRPSARARPAADRGLPGPPRARLPGRLHPLARAVAQAAGQPQRRAGAVGGAAPGLRARSRDRGVPAARILDGRGAFPHAGRRAVHRPAHPSRRQAARPVRPATTRPAPWRAKAAVEAGTFSVASRRAPPGQAQPAAAVHHLDPAAGGQPQARHGRAGDDALRPAALRGRRARRRDHRPDHLYADRRRADGARGHRRRSASMSASAYGRDYVPGAPREYTSKAKNAQEAHEAIRPTDVARTPESVARYLNAEQRRLYELIWKRAVASQMQSAELDQVAVDVASRRDQAARHRLDHRLRRLPQAVPRGRRRRAGRRRRRQPHAAADARARPAQPRQGHRRPAFHPAAAALLRGEPGQEDGGAGHRPALHLRQHPDRAARPQLRAAWRTSASSPRTAAAWSPPSSPASSSATSTPASPPRSRSSSTTSPAAGPSGARSCRRSGTSSPRRSSRPATSRSATCIDALDRDLGEHFFPARADGGDPRECPACHAGRLGLKLGRHGSFIGCSNYPACQYTRRLAIENGEDAGETLKEGMRELGHHPETGEPITVRRGPYGLYVQQGEADPEDKKAQAAPHLAAQGHGWRAASRWSRRSACCRCRGWSACIPSAASRSRPASAGSGPS